MLCSLHLLPLTFAFVPDSHSVHSLALAFAVVSHSLTCVMSAALICIRLHCSHLHSFLTAFACVGVCSRFSLTHLCEVGCTHLHSLALFSFAFVPDSHSSHLHSLAWHLHSHSVLICIRLRWRLHSFLTRTRGVLTRSLALAGPHLMFGTLRSLALALAFVLIHTLV